MSFRLSETASFETPNDTRRRRTIVFQTTRRFSHSPNDQSFTTHERNVVSSYAQTTAHTMPDDMPFGTNAQTIGRLAPILQIFVFIFKLFFT